MSEEIFEGTVGKEVIYFEGLKNDLKSEDYIKLMKLELITEISTKREVLKLTRNHIETELGIEIGCLSRIEKGKRNPKFETLIKIANYLGINVDIKIN